MKKNFTYLKALFLVMLLVAGSGAVWGQNVVWKLINSVNDLAPGEYLISTLNGSAVFNGTITSGHGQTVSVSNVAVDNTIPDKDVPASALIMTFTAGTTANSYLISNGGKYLAATKAASGGLALDAKYSDFYWTFSDTSDGFLVSGTIASGATVYLRDYNSGTFRTYGSKNGNELALYKKVVESSLPKPDFFFAVEEATATVGVDFTAPSLTNTSDGVVTYVSSDENVATVTDNGVVTIIGDGTTVITASVPETANFAPASAKYTLTVVDPNKFTTTLNFGDNTGWNFPITAVSTESVHTNNGVTCKISYARFLNNAGLFLNKDQGYVIVTALDNQIPSKIDLTTPSGSLSGSAAVTLFVDGKELGTTNVGQSSKTFTIVIPAANRKPGAEIQLKSSGANTQIAQLEISGPMFVQITEVTPGNIGTAGTLAPEVTASGDWTQSDIETLALILSENQVPVTSITFTGTVTSDADEIITMAPNCLKIFADGVTAPAAWTTNVVKLDASGKGTSASISLNASAAFATPVIINADEVSFLREGIVSGNKSTLYLPFAATLPEGFAAFTYNGVEGTTVKFTPVEGLVLAANTPYLITPNATEISISQTNVEILPEPGVTPSADYTFLGTYQTISAEGFYGFKDNGFKLGIAGATVPAFRAYLKPAASPSGAPAVLSIDVTGEGTTGIDNAVFEGTNVYVDGGVVYILTDQAQEVNVYGIDGRLVRTEMVGEGQHAVNGLEKGMYLVNGRKVIIK